MNFKVVLFLFCCLILPHTSNGQKKNKKITLTGKVINEAGAPLQGVNIYIDNIKTSAISKADGTYKIKVKPNIGIISAFSFADGGQVVEYEGQTVINFTLAGDIMPSGPDPKNAGKVVDIGYEDAKEENLTTSVGSVDLKDESRPYYRSIYDMIQGEVSGVLVSGTTITIRGASSVNSSNEPLFVVDGSPISSISHINPNDVESISILKGSAAAIYGTRGANGVILIDLKSGRKK